MKKRDDLVNTTDAAKLCRVSVAMFARYEIPQHSKAGRQVFYRRDDILDFIAERERKKGYQDGFRDGKKAAPDDVNDLLLRKEQAELALKQEQAETQRLKNEQTRRETARVDLLTFALGKVCAQIVATLDALPGHLKRSLPSLTASEIEIARREVAQCLNAVAEIDIDLDDYEGDGADS